MICWSRQTRRTLIGIALAGLVGAVLAATSAVIVVRYLPRRVTQSDALPIDLEELALAALISGYPEEEAEAVAG